MTVAEVLEAKFGSRVVSCSDFRDELTYAVAPEDWYEVLEFCKESPDLAFDMLDSLVGDHLPERTEAPLQVVVHLVSHTHGKRLRIKTALPEGRTLLTVTGLWPSADFDEREAWEMYGVYFTKHPNLRRLLTTEDFKGHPMRKDFPMQGTIGGRIRTNLKGKI
jgi:NADH-quinone oxidoreductase subunit C